jgi:SAM-dependent methyltransferase
MVLSLGGRVGRCQLFFFFKSLACNNCKALVVCSQCNTRLRKNIPLGRKQAYSTPVGVGDTLLVWHNGCNPLTKNKTPPTPNGVEYHSPIIYYNSLLKMKKWILKAVVQKCISFLPYRHKINYFFQKYITKGVFLTEDYFTDRLSHARDHINAYNSHRQSIENMSTLELGTGWYPVVPISMFLSGAETIHTVDISNLCDLDKLKTTINMFIYHLSKGTLEQFITLLPDRLALLKKIHQEADDLDFETILSKLNIIYSVQDARKLSLETDSIDLIHSNNTFEHVYPDMLESLLVEFKRVCKPEGIMSHFVDMSDHFAHFDKSISIYNFLKFSDKQWQLIDNSVQPQNRWRLPDYLELYKKLNLKLLSVETRKGSTQLLESIKINDKYKSTPIEELAISHCLLISA